MTTERPPYLLTWLRTITVDDLVSALVEDGSILDGIKAEVAALEAEARENLALAITEREAKESIQAESRR